jgi:hypothetical protein
MSRWYNRIMARNRKVVEPDVSGAPDDDEGVVDDTEEFARVERIAERIASGWAGTSSGSIDRTPPDVSHLDDAVELVEGEALVFTIPVGEQVLIERYLDPPDVPRRIWLDTRLYRVDGVDPETGRLELYDEGLKQMALSNYIDGLARGYTFKVPSSGLAGVRKRRGGRRKKGSRRK